MYRIKDNAGGQWTKDLFNDTMNFIFQHENNIALRKDILRYCFENYGLKPEKTMEYLSIYEDLGYITKNLDDTIKAFLFVKLESNKKTSPPKTKNIVELKEEKQ